MNEQTKDGLKAIIEAALTKMPEPGLWQKRFVKTLFSTVLLLRGRMNFSSLARHSSLNEKTYRRGFRRAFDFATFNLNCVKQRETKGELTAVKVPCFSGYGRELLA